MFGREGIGLIGGNEEVLAANGGWSNANSVVCAL